ncbi:hypothetical protein MXB_3421 [Myxobolus squamalis]|nr:hypothetical protein MXB_3421 [Myxobolus squamalis]
MMFLAFSRATSRIQDQVHQVGKFNFHPNTTPFFLMQRIQPYLKKIPQFPISRIFLPPSLTCFTHLPTT